MSSSEQPISVGNHGVGSITADSSQVTGEGGPVRPHLVVPIRVKLNARSKDEGQLAIPQLAASLGTANYANPLQEVCQPISMSLMKNMAVVSQIYDHPGSPLQLRFPLTPLEFASLEGQRHVQAGKEIALHLSIEPLVVGLQSSGELQEGSPWGHNLGLSSFMSVFWSVQVQSLSLTISQQTWIEKVLPGLGYDRLRMLEVRLPPQLPDHGSATAEFDKALAALDQRRYDECVAACRGLVKMWTNVYKATAASPLGEVIGRESGWPSDDPRRAFLTSTWNALIVMVNASHHPESSAVQPMTFQASEARLIFMLVSSISEYLGTAVP